MADKDKKAPPPTKTHPAEPVIVMFFVAAVLSAIAIRFSNFIDRHLGISRFFHNFLLFLQGDLSFTDLLGLSGHPGWAAVVWVFKILSFSLSVVLVWGIIVAYRKYIVTHAKLLAPIKPELDKDYDIKAPAGDYVNPKWAKVLEHVNSENPSDWKLGILEADIMLGEVLDKMGYHGSTIGDKLKSIEASDFTSLQEAWEAHKVRNSIAHEGSDYVVSKPEAERVIRLFEKIFKEFKYI